jgi:hypothetical protein
MVEKACQLQCLTCASGVVNPLAALNLRRQDRKKSAAWHVGRQLAAKLVSSFLKRPYVGLSLTYPVDGSALLARLHALFRINW